MNVALARNIIIQVIITVLIVAASSWYQERKFDNKLKSYAPVIIASQSLLNEPDSMDYYGVLDYFKQNGYIVLETSAVADAPSFYYLREPEYQAILKRIK